MTNNIVLMWLKETLQRLFTSSPVFFKVWNFIASALVLVTGVPAFVEWVINVAHSGGVTLVLPDWLAVLENKAVSYAALGALFMSMLSTQGKPQGVNEDGQVLKKTDEAKLPFTAKAEAKTAEKSGVTATTLVATSQQNWPKTDPQVEEAKEVIVQSEQNDLKNIPKPTDP